MSTRPITLYLPLLLWTLILTIGFIIQVMQIMKQMNTLLALNLDDINNPNATENACAKYSLIFQLSFLLVFPLFLVMILVFSEVNTPETSSFQTTNSLITTKTSTRYVNEEEQMDYLQTNCSDDSFTEFKSKDTCINYSTAIRTVILFYKHRFLHLLLLLVILNTLFNSLCLLYLFYLYATST